MLVVAMDRAAVEHAREEMEPLVAAGEPPPGEILDADAVRALEPVLSPAVAGGFLVDAPPPGRSVAAEPRARGASGRPGRAVRRGRRRDGGGRRRARRAPACGGRGPRRRRRRHRHRRACRGARGAARRPPAARRRARLLGGRHRDGSHDARGHGRRRPCRALADRRPGAHRGDDGASRDVDASWTRAGPARWSRWRGARRPAGRASRCRGRDCARSSPTGSRSSTSLGPRVFVATAYSMLGMTVGLPAGDALAELIDTGSRPRGARAVPRGSQGAAPHEDPPLSVLLT